MSRNAANATPRRALLQLAVRPLVVALIGTAIFAGCSGSSGGGSKPPPPGIGLSATSLATTEGGANVSFTVVLTTPPTTQVDIELTSNDSTEGQLLGPGDTYPSSWVTVSFTPQNWNVPQTVKVVPQHDTTPPEAATTVYTITATPWSWGDTTYLTVPARDITVTNSNIDIPGITVSKTTASTSEAPTNDTFTVKLNTAPTATVTIPVTSSDTSEGLLRGGNSPTTSQPTITLTFTTSNWSTPQTVAIYGQSDKIDDGNQTYNVTVGAPAGAPEYAALGSSTVSVRNDDIDTAGITITALPTLVTSENGTTATFTVKLNTMPAADVVIPVTSGNVAEGLVSAGTENLVNVAHLTFTATNYDVPQIVTITGQDEVTTQVPGDNVTYDVTVGPATGDTVYAALAAQAVHVLNTDNDTAALIIPAAGGTALQTTETGVGNAVTFTVGINKKPTTNVVVPVTVSDITEGLVMGGDSSITAVAKINLTFTPADFMTAQTVTVKGQVDNVVDGNQPYTITVGAPTGDTQYAAVAAQTLNVTNADTDIAGFTVAHAVPFTTTEGGAVNTFTVVLTKAPLADVVIPVSSSNAAEGLVAGGDSPGVFGSSLNLTFTPGNYTTPQTVQVKGPADFLDDGSKNYTITVGPTASSSTPYSGVAAQSFTVTNYNADISGFTVTPSSGLVTTEAGGTAAFTVKLNSIPSGTVTIPVSVNDSSEALVSAGVALPANFVYLYFTGSDWDKPQTVTVTGQQDSVLDGAQPWIVSVGPTTSGDAKYNNLTAKSVTGNTLDDEVGVSEGTSTTPAVVAAGTALSGQVGPASSSYYQINLAAGATFSVSLANATAAVTLTVDDNGNYSTGNFCTGVAVAVGGQGACTGTVPAGGAIYVKVSTSSSTGAGFTLTANTMQTFTSVDVPKSVPTDYNWVTSTVSASNATTAISKVRVKLSATHAYDVYYLEVKLTSPAGTSVTLMYYDGWGSTAVTNTVFDDAAANYLNYGTPPYTGTFKPYSPLSAFNGQNANGAWTLSLSTNTYGYGGSLTGWSIEIL
ncbi:MAG: proprotein convertase P-domain-containing protein [Anaeromyxobacteraceae bacterium]